MNYNSWLASSQSYVYVDTPNSNLVCCICRMPFVEPTTSRTCAHSFCRDCIGPALQASPQCPIDRSPLSPQDMTPSNPIVRHMVDELIVECLNRPAGCDFTCQRQLLAAHLKDDCLFAEEQCPDPECSNKALRKDILATSHAEICPTAIVACEHASHGCGWTGTRLALKKTHVTHCPYAALQGFFGISDARAAGLETENARLRARFNAAEGMLAVMRHELQAIKGALGPWYRPDTVAGSPPLSPHSQTHSPPYPFSPPSSTSAPVYPWRGHHEPPADVMAHMPITPGEDPSIAASVDAVSPHAVPGLHANIAPSDLAAYFPPTSGDATAPSSPNATSGRSLSTALTALRSALQTHDARSRMAASAHAAELAAMRQVVAGLRMQLHAMLMERSGINLDGPTAAVTGGWIPPARFFLNPPPPLGVGPGSAIASITKL
ncbi:hypothetical protein B0F90DRAFT_1643080 [Multifurca ochricompacta]|uniref:Uncharacterized protein n=1 Tax=Multifurca ochricompacta TaxID=376703 RepID=A0AAD4QIV9_9AGAM|nr:hypothetical protein B0F90DRAFT_1643080 [Multifurca ochricompacta]